MAGLLKFLGYHNGIGDTALQGVVGIDQENGSVRIDLGEFAKGGQFIGKALDPGMGLGA